MAAQPTTLETGRTDSQFDHKYLEFINEARPTKGWLPVSWPEIILGLIITTPLLYEGLRRFIDYLIFLDSAQTAIGK